MLRGVQKPWRKCDSCSGEGISITHSECVTVELGIQHVMRVRHIVMWPVRLCNIYPHYLINGTIFFKKKLLTTICVFCFPLQLLSETFLILIRT
jgi:hypothetical protein